MSIPAQASFTNVSILRPFPNFETAYQNVSADTPIYFPGGRDEAAGSDGYSPNLAAGLRVPFGARVCIWVPLAVRFDEVTQTPVFTLYRYRIFWRFRNLRDYRLPPRGSARKPYHMPISRSGAPDTTVSPPQPRVIIPAAGKVVAYEQPEPAFALGHGVLNVYDEEFIPRASGTLEGLLPGGGKTVMAQGIFDPGVTGPSTIAGDPIFQPFWFDAEGDDMILTAVRIDADTPGQVWDFTTTDRPFSNIYGTDNGAHPPFEGAGIYVVTGMNP